MATWYAKIAGDWFAENAWNSTAAGDGSDATAPLTAADTADLNGKAMTTTNGSSITQALVQAATGTLTPTGTLTINGSVTYSGTSTGGMIIYGTGATLTILSGTVTNSGAGRCLVGSGSGVLVVNNNGGTALSNTAGQCVHHGSTGAYTITGDVSSDGDAYQAYCIQIAAAATGSVTGNLTHSGAQTGVQQEKGTITFTGNVNATDGIGINVYSGTLVFAGNAKSSGDAEAIRVAYGTCNWLGNRSLAASDGCYILQQAGTFNLATASDKLTLANSGTLVIFKIGGTLNTADAGAGAASIVNQTATSYAAILGGSDAQKAIITGPTLPAAADVEVASGTYGYAGGLLTPAFVVPLEEDVELAVEYGAAAEFTGTLAAGGGGAPVFGGHVVRRV